MSPAELKSRSYDQAEKDFFAAEATAEAALGEVFDLGSRIALWTDGERTLLDDLTARARLAELCRRQAHDRLLYTFTDYLDAVLHP